MKTTIYYFHVTTPEGDLVLLGGPLKPDGHRHVWLTKPDGERLLRVHRDCVRPITREEAAEAIMASVKQNEEASNV